MSEVTRAAMTRGVAALSAVVVAALLVAEATMQPSARDRSILIAVFAGTGAVTLVAAAFLGRLTRRLSSLRTAVMAVAVGAVASATLAVLASAATMFLSGHDLRLVLVALGLGVGLGSVAATTVAGMLATDLDSIREVTEAVARGDRARRTNVDRTDEVGALATAFDRMVDQLQAAEEERDRMEESRRLFLAAVSHDLRTPLTSLRSALEAMEDGIIEDPMTYVPAMQADVAHLASLVDDLFLLATIESGGLRVQRELVDLAELADESLEAVAPTARGIGVSLTLDAEGPARAQVDAHQVRRVVRNLLDNAIRHSPEGGTVRVGLSARDDGWRLTVDDDGAGFPEAFLDHAFDSFTRPDEARTRADGGAGLGLAIARGLVEAHGGSIGARTGPGGHVEITLPAA